MKRLIKKANAYDWVSERAKHIRSENPDMDKGMEYGIAWKQYKKEHPKWKNKKEKAKKKKTASRLVRVADAEFEKAKGLVADLGSELDALFAELEQMKIQGVDLSSKIDKIEDNLNSLDYYLDAYNKQTVAAYLKKVTAEFVYCDQCHWDNGDFMWNDDGTMQEWAAKLEGTKKMKKLKENQIYKCRKEFDEKNDGTCPECGAEDSLHLD